MTYDILLSYDTVLIQVGTNVSKEHTGWSWVKYVLWHTYQTTWHH